MGSLENLPPLIQVLIVIAATLVTLGSCAALFFVGSYLFQFLASGNDPNTLPDSSNINDADRFGLELVDADTALTTEQRHIINEHGPAAWQFHPPAEETPNMLVREGVTMLFLARVRTSQTTVPVPTCLTYKNVFYFEVTITNKPGGSLVSIGLAPKGYPQYMLGPGWTQFSYGFRSDGRKFVDGLSSPMGEVFGEAFSGGDVIGCGFNTNGSVFFTKNGKALETAAKQVPTNIALYPSIGATRGVLLNVNFGQERFVFMPAEQHNLGYMTDRLPAYMMARRLSASTLADLDTEPQPLPPPLPSAPDVDVAPSSSSSSSSLADVPHASPPTLASAPPPDAPALPDSLAADRASIELPRTVLRWSLTSHRSLPPDYDTTLMMTPNASRRTSAMSTSAESVRTYRTSRDGPPPSFADAVLAAVTDLEAERQLGDEVDVGGGGESEFALVPPARTAAEVPAGARMASLLQQQPRPGSSASSVSTSSGPANLHARSATLSAIPEMSSSIGMGDSSPRPPPQISPLDLPAFDLDVGQSSEQQLWHGDGVEASASRSSRPSEMSR